MSFIDRFKEPSSWAGLGLILNLIAPFLGLSGDAISALMTAGSAVCGAAAIVMKEKGMQ